MKPDATPSRMADLKPDANGFRYVLMWIDFLIEKNLDADQSYLIEWRKFIADCQALVSETRAIDRLRQLIAEFKNTGAVWATTISEAEAALQSTPSAIAPNVEDAGMSMGDPHPCDMTPAEREKFFQPSDKPSRLQEAMAAVEMLCEFAYEQGFHEMGYDPVAEVKAALSATRAPEGWKIVPIVPTEKMIDAAMECAYDANASNGTSEIYTAMVLTAPEYVGGSR